MRGTFQTENHQSEAAALPDPVTSEFSPKKRSHSVYSAETSNADHEDSPNLKRKPDDKADAVKTGKLSEKNAEIGLLLDKTLLRKGPTTHQNPLADEKLTQKGTSPKRSIDEVVENPYNDARKRKTIEEEVARPNPATKVPGKLDKNRGNALLNLKPRIPTADVAENNPAVSAPGKLDKSRGNALLDLKPRMPQGGINALPLHVSVAIKAVERAEIKLSEGQKELLDKVFQRIAESKEENLDKLLEKQFLDDFQEDAKSKGFVFQGLTESFLDGISQEWREAGKPEQHIQKVIDLLFFAREGEYIPESKFIYKKGKDKTIALNKHQINTFKTKLNGLSDEEARTEFQGVLSDFTTELRNIWSNIDREATGSVRLSAEQAKYELMLSKKRLKNIGLLNSSDEIRSQKELPEKHVTILADNSFSLPIKAEILSHWLEWIIDKQKTVTFQDIMIPAMRELTSNVLLLRRREEEKDILFSGAAEPLPLFFTENNLIQSLYIDNEAFISRNIRGRDDAINYKNINKFVEKFIVDLWPEITSEKQNISLYDVLDNVREGLLVILPEKENSTAIEKKASAEEREAICKLVYDRFISELNHKNQFLANNAQTSVTDAKKSLEKLKEDCLPLIIIRDSKELTNEEKTKQQNAFLKSLAHEDKLALMLKFRTYDDEILRIEQKIKDETELSKQLKAIKYASYEDIYDIDSRTGNKRRKTINSDSSAELMATLEVNILKDVLNNRAGNIFCKAIVFIVLDSMNRYALSQVNQQKQNLQCIEEIKICDRYKNETNKNNSVIKEIDDEVKDFHTEIIELREKVSKEIESGEISQKSKDQINSLISKLNFDVSSFTIPSDASEENKTVIEGIQATTKKLKADEEIIKQQRKKADTLYVRIIHEIETAGTLTADSVKEYQALQTSLNMPAIVGKDVATPVLITNGDESSALIEMPKAVEEVDSQQKHRGIFWYSSKYSSVREQFLNALESLIPEKITYRTKGAGQLIETKRQLNETEEMLYDRTTAMIDTAEKVVKVLAIKQKEIDKLEAENQQLRNLFTVLQRTAPHLLQEAGKIVTNSIANQTNER